MDAIDIGNYADGTVSSGVVIEGCRIRDFPFDKGVSVGEGATGIVVRDCIILDVDSGIAVKDSAEAELYHNTIAASSHGLNLYEKVAGQGGGHATKGPHDVPQGGLQTIGVIGEQRLERIQMAHMTAKLWYARNACFP